MIKYCMPTFITPYTGTAQLTASNGLSVQEQGLWRFSQSGYNDGATFGLSLTHPSPLSGGTLSLSGQGWSIAVIGNTLTAYTDPDTMITYPASQCRITVTGRWVVIRQQNSNSFNGQGISYGGQTTTDQGGRAQGPYLLTYQSGLVTYTIQGADVSGGAIDNFTSHEFTVVCTETASSDNSNREFQSNTIIRPTWNYTYAKSWQTAP